MAVDRFLRLLPLNKTAFELQGNLQSKVEGWLVDDDWEFTVIKDWFHKVFTKPKAVGSGVLPRHLGKLL